MKIWDSAKAFRTNHLFVRGGSMIYQVASTYNLVTFRQNCMEMKKIGPKGAAFEFFLCRSATTSLKCIFNANKMKFYTVQRSSIPILLHFKVCFVDVSTRIIHCFTRVWICIVFLQYEFVSVSIGGSRERNRRAAPSQSIFFISMHFLAKIMANNRLTPPLREILDPPLLNL